MILLRRRLRRQFLVRPVVGRHVVVLGWFSFLMHVAVYFTKKCFVAVFVVLIQDYLSSHNTQKHTGRQKVSSILSSSRHTIFFPSLSRQAANTFHEKNSSLAYYSAAVLRRPPASSLHTSSSCSSFSSIPLRRRSRACLLPGSLDIVHSRVPASFFSGDDASCSKWYCH